MLTTIVKFTYMNERGGAPERIHWLMAGPTERLVQNLQIARAKEWGLLHTSNITSRAGFKTSGAPA